MGFDEAIRKAIEAYWEGYEPEVTHKEMAGRPKYTKKYFDSFEAKHFGKSDVESNKIGDME